MRGKSHLAVKPSPASLAGSISALITEKTTPFVPSRPVLPVAIDEVGFVEETTVADAVSNEGALAEVEETLEVDAVEVAIPADEELEAVALVATLDSTSSDIEADEDYVAAGASSPFAPVDIAQEAAAVDAVDTATHNVLSGEVDLSLVPEHLKAKFNPDAALRIDSIDVSVDTDTAETAFINGLTAGLHESAEANQVEKKKPRRPWARQQPPVHVEKISTPPIIEQLAEYSESEFGTGISDLVPPPALVSEVDPDLEGFDPSRYFGLGAMQAVEPSSGPDLSTSSGLSELVEVPNEAVAPAVPDFTEVAEKPDEPVRDSRAVMQMLRELAALRHE